MKINFTKKEYQALVEILLIADWVIRSNETEPREETKPYNELRKKVLCFHKEMGMEHQLRYDPKHDEYYETSEYEEGSDHMRFIEGYDEESFWPTLAGKLAARDLAAKDVLTPELKADEEKRRTELFQLITDYEQELVENGLDHLRLGLKERRQH
jgi:hypothetical protein